MKTFSSIVIHIILLLLKEAFAADTLHNQLSGYGCSLPMVQKCLDIFEVKDQLEAWDEEVVAKFVNVFHSVRFPTVIVRRREGKNINFDLILISHRP